MVLVCSRCSAEIVILGGSPGAARLLDIGRTRPTEASLRDSATIGLPTTGISGVFLVLLVRSDLIASVADLASIAFLADDWDSLAIDGTAGLPLVWLPHAVPSLVQVVNEVSFIFLTTNDAFLDSNHSW